MRPTWKYVNPASTSGIYSNSDLDLHNVIMFVERSSILNTIARGTMGQRILEGSIDD